MRVIHLKIRLGISSIKHDKVLHGAKQPIRPAMAFQAPVLKTEASSPGEHEPSSAENHQDKSEHAEKPSPSQVADKVYDIMLQEIRNQKIRNGG